MKLYIDDLEKVKGQVKDFAEKLTSDDFTIPPASLKDPAGSPEWEDPGNMPSDLNVSPYDKMLSQYRAMVGHQDINISFTDLQIQPNIT